MPKKRPTQYDWLPEGWQVLQGKEPQRSAEEEALIAEMRRTRVVTPAKPGPPIDPVWLDEDPPIPGLSLSDLVIELRG